MKTNFNIAVTLIAISGIIASCERRPSQADVEYEKMEAMGMALSSCLRSFQTQDRSLRSQDGFFPEDASECLEKFGSFSFSGNIYHFEYYPKGLEYRGEIVIARTPLEFGDRFNADFLITNDYRSFFMLRKKSSGIGDR